MTKIQNSKLDCPVRSPNPVTPANAVVRQAHHPEQSRRGVQKLLK